VCPAGTVTILVNAMFAIPVENLPIEFTFSFPFHTVIDFTTVSALIQKGSQNQSTRGYTPCF
ncbi:MAG: hypothetical protein J6Y29_00795, partial [Clostridiales bacterium]|nr:hypothetical protein [Clostridiales bacterium]